MRRGRWGVTAAVAIWSRGRRGAGGGGGRYFGLDEGVRAQAGVDLELGFGRCRAKTTLPCAPSRLPCRNGFAVRPVPLCRAPLHGNVLCRAPAHGNGQFFFKI